MKNIKRYLNRFARFYASKREPILLTTILMTITFLVGMFVAPGEYTYKSEITEIYMDTQTLTERVEQWEELAYEARLQIKENNERISLLSELISKK